MKENPMASEPGAGRGPGLIEVAVIVLLGGALGGFGIAWVNLPVADAAGRTVARCDRMAQIVSSRNHAARDAQWRRERESEFAACLEDPVRFARVQGVQ